MARLKIHPRETLSNATALARADALFVELTGADRDVVGAAIATFRTALAAQEPAAIEPMRQHLTALIRRLGPR
jgi:molecular chaperone HscC